MKTREELLHRIPIDEFRSWPAFRRRFIATWFSGVVLAFSGMLSPAFVDQLPSAAAYLEVFGRVAFPAGLLLVFVGIPAVILRIRCPRCGHRLNVKQWTTDTKGVVFPCEPCRIGWSTGMLPYFGTSD